MIGFRYVRLTALFISLVAFDAIPDSKSDPDLKIVLETFDEWQVSQSVFCPDEPVVVRITVTNIGTNAIELRIGYGAFERAYFNVTGASGKVVWDTDEIDRLEEEQHVREFGMGRIFVGRGEHRTRILNPRDSAFWSDRWEQKDLDGNLVPEGRYSITMDYRWIYSNGGREAASTPPVEISISSTDCH